MGKADAVTDVNILKCISSQEECKKHFCRITACRQKLQALFPLTIEKLNNLSEIELALLDQFLYRFSKLQDAIGNRLIPVIYGLAEQDDTPKPFIDILNRLEKLNFLISVKDWQYFRNIRNSFAHEYPEREDDIIQAINRLYDEWNIFEALYLQLDEAASKLIRAVS